MFEGKEYLNWNFFVKNGFECFVKYLRWYKYVFFRNVYIGLFKRFRIFFIVSEILLWYWFYNFLCCIVDNMFVDGFILFCFFVLGLFFMRGLYLGFLRFEMLGFFMLVF